MNKKIKLAIVGATGVVGRTVLNILEEKNLPDIEYKLFASKKSAGKKLQFMNKEYIIHELTPTSFDEKFDYAIFSAGSETSKKYSPIAIKNNCIVIDNSSAFRMNEDVPLVVPEVNKPKIYENHGIIANPNCSTIQAVVALKPLDDKYTIKRIIYSTYQAVSGAGKYGIEDLQNGINGEKTLHKFPYKIYNNCLPQIDEFLDNGYTKEEEKMINETRKILDKPKLPITATTVRVPVFNSHCESINIEFENDFNIEELKQTLKNSNGIILKDDPQNKQYPIPEDANGYDDVFVGRVRKDFSVPHGINLWIVADNIRKGAATNAIQILEELLKQK